MKSLRQIQRTLALFLSWNNGAFLCPIRLLVFALAVFGWSFSGSAYGSIVNQPMTGATAPGWVVGGSAYLTASTGVDPVGNGWLRLTDPGLNQAGYGFLDTPFDISQGVVIQFDYATWGGTGADGYSIYLFDAVYDASTFVVGASGGSLGYAQKTVAPIHAGLTGGYIGVGIDEYGNYSNQTEGRVDLAPLGVGSGFFPNEVGVRGPAVNTYDWLGGSGSLAQQLAFNNQGYRPIQTGVQYRKVVIYLTPQSAPNYLRVDVYLQFGANQALTPVVTGLMTGSPIPASVKVGYAASTGGSTNYHEIRNLVVDPLSTDINLALTKTSSVASVAPGGALTYTVTARNYGPNLVTATNAPVTDTFSSWLTGVTWTCTGSGGGTCGAAAGSGNINTTATLPFNGAAVYTVSAAVSAATPVGTQIVNTATVTAPAGVTDYNLSDNSASATVAVTGAPVSISGMVYSDSGAGGGTAHNGIMDGTEGSTGIANIYAKLFRSSDMTTALQAVLVPTAAGTFTFNNVPSYGTYTIILSTNNTLTDPTPGFPSANWIYTSPYNYTLSNITVGAVNVTNQNFGVFNGSRISGKVIRDDGVNGAASNANDGVLNAAETGISGVTIRLTNNTGATQYDTTTTGSGGDFVLFTNTASANLRVYETNLAGYTSVNFNGGTTGGAYTMAGEYIQFAYTLYTDYSKILFSDVPDNAFGTTPQAQSGTALAPVYYAHTFAPGSGGSVSFTTFSRTQGAWPAVAYFKDVNCNGVYDGGDVAMPVSVTLAVGTPICVLVQENISSGATNGTTDAIVTRATFTYTNSMGPVVRTYDVTDTSTVMASNLSTSTKTWTDQNNGDQNPNDVIRYTITLIETSGNAASGVSVTDTVPAALTNLSTVSCPAGATCNVVGQTLTVTNITVPASGSVSILFDVTIAAATAAGTLIDNTATITNPAGPGAAPAAPTITVSTSAVPGSGNKPLYLYGAASYQLSRTPTPGVPAVVTVNRGSFQTWSESPVLQSSDTITNAAPFTGVVPVQLYLSSSAARTLSVTVDLYCSATPATFITLNNAAVNLTTAVTLFTFNLPLAAPMSCAAGNSWVIKVTNAGAVSATRPLYVSPVNGLNISNVNLPSLNVINVGSVTSYSTAYPGVTAPASFSAGATVYVRSVVSDPFGSFDITSATVTIKDPNNTTVVTSAAMTMVNDSGAATKTYEYSYTVPATGPVGFWTTTVTAKEGTENTVSDSGVGTFLVKLMPSLTVVKSVQTYSDPVNATTNPKAIPGSVMLYTILVTNSGAGAVDNNTIVITDPIPTNTSLFVGDINGAGSGPVLFVDGAVISGLGYSFISLSSAADSVSFSNNGGATYAYSPVPDPNGFDANVTNIKISLSGIFKASSGGSNPSFGLKFKLMVN